MRHNAANLKRFKGARAVRRSRGITLVELVVAASLIGLVGLSFAFLYFMANEQMVQNIDITTSQTEASFAVEHLRRHVVMATEITSPAEGNTDTTLIYRWWDTAAVPAVERIATYQHDNVDLELEFDDGSGAGVVRVARHITALNFNRTDRTAVEVTVTANQGGRPATITTTITSRSSF